MTVGTLWVHVVAIQLMNIVVAIEFDFQKHFEQECIPVGCVPPAAVAVTGVVSTHPPWSRQPPWVWAWRPPQPPPSPLGVGLETPPSPSLIPLNFSLGCGPGDPPGQIPLNFPLGVGLETCKACWDTTCNACWDTTPSPPPWTDTHL